MRLNNKTIWQAAAIFCSVCLLILAAVFIYSWLHPAGKLTVWPRDEARQLRAQNQTAVEAAGRQPITGVHPFDPKVDYFQGRPDGKVKLIVYTDFDCPFCAGFNGVLDQAAKQFPDDVAIVYRNFPLDSHPLATGAANAWLCAAEQGKWREAKDLLYEMINKSEEKYLAMAKTLKLDNKQFADCLATDKYRSRILADKAEAKSAGVSGTPTSFLNGLILPGAYQINDFSDPSSTVKKGLATLIKEQLNK